MKLKPILLIIFISLAKLSLISQETFPHLGTKDERKIHYAFQHAHIVVSADKVIDDATLLIFDNKIVAVGQNIIIPKDAVKYDLQGKFIYPSFIDIHTTLGMPRTKTEESGFRQNIDFKPDTKGAYNANDAIKAQFNAVEYYNAPENELKKFRSAGFGTVLSFRDDGIIRGTSALVALLDSSEINKAILKARTSMNYSFDKGSSKQTYPFSEMGMVALLRQTLYDAQWYGRQKDVGFEDQSLKALNLNTNLPEILSANSLQDMYNAGKITKEFNKPFIIKASGEEYRDLISIKILQAPLIVPINFPEPYDVEDPWEAEQVSLSQLKHWELAPYNLRYLQDINLPLAVTAYGLEDMKDFMTNLKKAVKNGFTENNAIKSLTTIPASLLKMDDQLGTIETGKLASFIITSDNYFTGEGVLLENWVLGKRYIISNSYNDNLFSNYLLELESDTLNLSITNKKGKPQFKLLTKDSVNLKIKGEINDRQISLQYSTDTLKTSGTIRLSGWFTAEGFEGQGQTVAGKWVKWMAKRTTTSDTEKSPKKEEEQKPGAIWYPLEAYGQTKVPEPEDMLIKNATVWTLEGKEEILENTDILIKAGKIEKVGKNLNANNVKVIDANGKNVTPGIIDEHSHIALSSINDLAANSSMVRMADVLDPQNIFIYRQLAGGVTTSQLLHGSANPIGGQSAIIKLRWGKNPEGLLLKEATPFIKFALGENVKFVWMPSNTSRYPNTRMGVEQFYEDAFTNAGTYKKQWDNYKKLKNIPEPRRDLSLDALVEILEGKRQITCHSYVQSEINMLMKVAERHGFKVNTFTHILEGYKVADKMKVHGAGASTFSDWWAYKFEVYEASAYNASLMAQQGLTVAIGSDDAEMARRLNQEAAKSVKYGGMSQTEALKMVTLNPAKLLHLDKRMGSIAVGKDADIVIWSGNPLSIYSKVEKTIIDGTVYYDLETDKLLREANLTERNRIIQKMIQVKKSGEKTQKAKPSGYRNLHCDDL